MMQWTYENVFKMLARWSVLTTWCLSEFASRLYVVLRHVCKMEEDTLSTFYKHAIQLSNKVIISICVHYFDNEESVTKISYEHLFLHFMQEHAHKVSKHTYDSLCICLKLYMAPYGRMIGE
jgi:hypothetical protein